MERTRQKIGLAQVDCVVGDVDANVEKITGYVDEYGDDVDLLAFPEYATTGHGLGEGYFDASLRLDDPPFKRLLEASRKTTLAVGFIEETDDFHLYNSLAILRGGMISRIHRKVYLQNYGIFEEKKYFAAGDDYETVRQGRFRYAPLICGDAWNPGIVHLGALKKAHVYLFSTCSPGGGLGPEVSSERNWKRLNRLFATLYGCYVLFVNRVGTDEGTTFWGGSEVIDPFGEPVASTDSSDEDVVLAELDLDRVREARQVLYTTRDERLDFLKRQFSKL